MDLKEWGKEDEKKSNEQINKALEKLAKNQKIDLLGDLCPELVGLKDESYAALHPGHSFKGCEHFPRSNLGLLLGSGLYDKILVPLQEVRDKSSFELTYGLSENRGAHLNFEQFLHLVGDGKLKICLIGRPEIYKAKFFQKIFKECDDLPIFFPYRIGAFLHRTKMTALAMSEQITPSRDWQEKVLKLHPEYDLGKCRESIRCSFGEYLKTTVSFVDAKDEAEAAVVMSSWLWYLRLLGFERLTNLWSKCASLDREFGYYMLSSFDGYLVRPVIGGLFASENYSYRDILNMSYFNMLPKKLEIIWKDILSSSPTSSTITGPRLGLDTVDLRGFELLSLIEDFHDDYNAKRLRQNIVGVEKSLGQFDFRSAESGFEKVDEIITESINSEIKGYEKKGRIVNHLLRLGKTFTSMTTEGSAVLSGFLAAEGKFDLAIASIAGVGASAWIRERLGEIKVEDIVRWLSRSWPFDDSGIGFFIWEKAQQAKSVDN